VNCADCGFSLAKEEVGDSDLLAVEMASLETTGRCYACAFVRRLEQRIDELRGEVECQTNEG